MAEPCQAPPSIRSRRTRGAGGVARWLVVLSVLASLQRGGCLRALRPGRRTWALRAQTTEGGLPATPSLPAAEAPGGEETAPGAAPATPQLFDVVLCHSTADYDTLAAAVGLAKLWQHEDPSVPVYVCMPRGAHPSVARFLALHQQLLPLAPLAVVQSRVFGEAAVNPPQRAGKKKRRKAHQKAAEAAEAVEAADARASASASASADSGHVEAAAPASTPADASSHAPSSQAASKEAPVHGAASPAHDTRKSIPHVDLTAPQEAPHPSGDEDHAAGAAPPEATGVDERLVYDALVWAKDEIREVAGAPTPPPEVPVPPPATVLRKKPASSDASADATTERPSPLRRLGLVDAQARDRVGPAAPLLDHCASITVVDHHVEANCDFSPDVYFVDRVGSVTTLIVEKLSEASLLGELSEVEATLLALGIHADTGSLTFDSSTWRDARALTDVMRHGASQQAVAEFKHAAPTPPQRGALMHAMADLRRVQCGSGATIGVALLANAGDTAGLARVTEDLLELSAADAVLLGATAASKKKQNPTLVLCGRARASGGVGDIDLGAVLQTVGGGGHPRAAAATAKLPPVPEGHDDVDAAIMASAEDVMDKLLHAIEAQLVTGTKAAEVMTSPVLSVTAETPIERAGELMTKYQIGALPVVQASAEVRAGGARDGGLLLGLLTRNGVDTAVAAGREWKAAKTLMTSVHQLTTVSMDTPLAEVEGALLRRSGPGRVVVVWEDGTIAGMITRTDLLRSRRHYSAMHYENRAFSMPINTRGHGGDKPGGLGSAVDDQGEKTPEMVRAFLSKLRRELKRFDVD